MEAPSSVRLYATQQRQTALVEFLNTAGFDVDLVRNLEDRPRPASVTIVDRDSFESAREFAATLCRVSSESESRIAIGVTSSPGVQAEALAMLAKVCSRGAVDLCLESQLVAELTSRIAICTARSIRAFRIDSLTGLGTRASMRIELAELLASFPTDRFAASFILDLDHFKSVNDSYGHVFGDRVLGQVGEIIRNFKAVGVHAFRIGGDEIGGYLVDSSRGAIVETLETIARAIGAATFEFEGISTRMTASVGFSFVDGGTDLEDAFRNPDQALYAAKTAGRNRVHPFDLTWEAAEEDPGIAAFTHFENVTQLWAQRFASTVLAVGKRAFDVSRSSADRDGLTDLSTRRYFDRRMRREIANALKEARNLSVVLTDVDNFHDVNMEHGYPSGDAALRQIAEVVRNHSRSTDWVARYGGEEFCVVMPGADADDARVVAERIRVAVASMTIEGFEGRSFGVTISAGIASLREVGRLIEDPDPLIQIASDRVIAAKRQGKNRVVER